MHDNLSIKNYSNNGTKIDIRLINQEIGFTYNERLWANLHLFKIYF